MRHLLDTNIVSDLVRNPQGRIAERIAEVGEDTVCTSVVVAAELRFGAAKKRSERLTKQLDRVLAALPILPFEQPADEAYGRLRAQLEAAGTPIGGNDMLIAAHAISSACTLVTDNEREFARIRELNILNWLR
ncbi:MAG: type II toxin-antitoxin system VapC family toxin [Phenylobacterium sp.]